MDMIPRALYSLLTLYMLLVLLRWFGPWLSLPVEEGRFRWISRLTDPLIDSARRILPPMGPVDFAPIAALLAVWFAREISLRMLLG